MKTCSLVSVVVVALMISVSETRSQSCDTAIVLPNRHVLIRWCCSAVPTVNLFGTSVQRRKELDSTFVEVPRSICICPASTPCSIVDTTVSAGVWYYRIREIDLDGTSTFRPPMRVEIPRLTNVQEELPIQFGLEQNYPNPFNPTTEIRYSIASGRDLGRSADGQTSEVSHVTLKVYDMLGREVTTLVNETKEPGYYSVRWNASGIASGVYYYWLRAGEYMATKQLVLLK